MAMSEMLQTTRAHEGMVSAPHPSDRLIEDAADPRGDGAAAGF